MKAVLWKKIYRLLVRNIATGQWSVGTTIPPETDLVKTYKVSRDTMRKALGEMVKQGFLERTPRTGTRVVHGTDQSGFSLELSSIRAIDEFGNTFPRHILRSRIETLDETTAHRLGLPVGATKFCFCNIRTAPHRNNEVVVATFVYVDTNDANIYKQALERPYELIVTLLEKKRGEGCTEVRQTFLASRMPEDVADLFHLPTGSPCLVIVRNYFNSKHSCLTASVSYHPAESYTISFTAKKKTSVA